jgi:hypothetical protein
MDAVKKSLCFHILTRLFSISFMIFSFNSAMGKLLRNSVSSLPWCAGGIKGGPVFNRPLYLLLSFGDLPEENQETPLV